MIHLLISIKLRSCFKFWLSGLYNYLVVTRELNLFGILTHNFCGSAMIFASVSVLQIRPRCSRFLSCLLSLPWILLVVVVVHQIAYEIVARYCCFSCILLHSVVVLLILLVRYKRRKRKLCYVKPSVIRAVKCMIWYGWFFFFFRLFYSLGCSTIPYTRRSPSTDHGLVLQTARHFPTKGVISPLHSYSTGTRR